MTSTASDKECLSVDSLDRCKMEQKKKKLRKFSRQRKTYLELYQSRLNLEHLKHQKCENELQDNLVDDNEKIHAEKQREVRMKPSRRQNPQSDSMQQKNNSKIEMLKRRTEYGCRMSSLNRINSSKDLHSHQRQLSSISLIDKNASTTKIDKEKISKESTCEIFKRKGEELQAKLEQMQIIHFQDKRKVEKIRKCLMSNGIDELKMKEQ